ncbi:hypothetical protein ACQCX2_02525 [Propionibacteriaceae bacterium Y1700]|uniref:hypothetical protein n=1 Tax=Microlunatus sp. Y1700 TaxID=3418487 RepID=UPI003DA79E2F
MEMHLQDWLGDHPFTLWLLIIPILLAGEVLRPRRVFASVIPAALVGALAALIGPGTWWLQVFLAGAVAAVGLVTLRPRLLASNPPAPEN